MPLLKATRRPFHVVLTEQDKSNLMANAQFFGVPYGVFFTTSGAAYYEQINPSAQYHYIWRTDQPEATNRKEDSAKSQPRQTRT